MCIEIGNETPDAIFINNISMGSAHLSRGCDRENADFERNFDVVPFGRPERRKEKRAFEKRKFKSVNNKSSLVVISFNNIVTDQERKSVWSARK